MAITTSEETRTTVYPKRDGFDSTDQTRPMEYGRGLMGLVRELRDETMQLVQQEIELAKTEMSEKVSRVSRNSVYLGIGAAIAAASLVILLMAASAGLYVGLVAAGLTHETSGWLGPLIVAIVAGLIGYGFIQKAISTLRSEQVMPEQTAETIREDKEWLERKVH
jgi:Putative Actinobacterial Holin-X, holin superfamily III